MPNEACGRFEMDSWRGHNPDNPHSGLRFAFYGLGKSWRHLLLIGKWTQDRQASIKVFQASFFQILYVNVELLQGRFQSVVGIQHAQRLALTESSQLFEQIRGVNKTVDC